MARGELSVLQRVLAPLTRRVRLMVSRAVVSLVDDALKLQGLQLTLLAGETADAVERFQEYGFTSVPEDGAEAIALAVGGSRSHLVVIAVDDRRHRKMNLAAGEVAIYSKFASSVHLKADGSAVVQGTQILIGDGATEPIPLGDALATLFNGHTHLGNLGAPTGGPLQPMGPTHVSAFHKVK